MLQVLNARLLGAPNLWHSRTVLHVEVAAEAVHGDDLLQLIPQLKEKSAALFLDQTADLPTTAHLLMRVSILLQRLHAGAIEFGIVRPTNFPRVWNVVFETEDAAIGHATLDAAFRLIEFLTEPSNVSVTDVMNEYELLVKKHRLGERTRHLVQAARERGIPVIRLDNESLLQLGQGIHRQRLLTAITDRTSLLAETISRDKHLCRQMFSSVGLPVVEGIVAEDAEAAVRFAKQIRQPVVVKPRDADYGNGVSLNLSEPAQIRLAWRKARSYSCDVIVERHQIGDWHRLLVVNHRIIAAARRVAPRIIGDGQRTVSELVAEFNADPRRGTGSKFPLEQLRVGAIELAVLYHQGLGLNSIPLLGAEVALREDAYLATGATQTDVTDCIHPEIAAIVVEAAAMIGLDVAGIDVISTDLSKPPGPQSLAILEVNAEPAFTMHLSPYNVPLLNKF